MNGSGGWYHLLDAQDLWSGVPLVPGRKGLAVSAQDDVSPRYRLVERLGSGTFGEVYKATQLSLDRDVALKFLKAQWRGDPIEQGRFQHECRVLASLSHPRILRVFDCGIAGNVPYLITELTSGTSLSKVLAQGKRVEPPRAVAIAIQILEALECLEWNQIVHRDVKPGNIFLTSESDIVLGDFGLATTGTFSCVNVGAKGITGTPAYMAPELFRGEPHSAATDLYAAGLILYEMLAGRLTNRGGRDLGAMGYIDRELAPLQAIVPGCPPGLCRLVDRWVDVEPARRIPSVDEALANLQSIEADFVRAGLAAARVSIRTSRLPPMPPLHPAGAPPNFNVAAGSGGPDPVPRDGGGAPAGSQQRVPVARTRATEGPWRVGRPLALLAMGVAGLTLWATGERAKAPPQVPPVIVASGSPEAIKALPMDVAPLFFERLRLFDPRRTLTRISSSWSKQHSRPSGRTSRALAQWLTTQCREVAQEISRRGLEPLASAYRESLVSQGNPGLFLAPEDLARYRMLHDLMSLDRFFLHAHRIAGLARDTRNPMAARFRDLMPGAWRDESTISLPVAGGLFLSGPGLSRRRLPPEVSGDTRRVSTTIAWTEPRFTALQVIASADTVAAAAAVLPEASLSKGIDGFESPHLISLGDPAQPGCLIVAVAVEGGLAEPQVLIVELGDPHGRWTEVARLGRFSPSVYHRDECRYYLPLDRRCAPQGSARLRVRIDAIAGTLSAHQVTICWIGLYWSQATFLPGG